MPHSVRKKDGQLAKTVMELKSHYNDRILRLTKHDIKIFKNVKAELKPMTWKNIFCSILEKLPHFKAKVGASPGNNGAMECDDLLQKHITAFGCFWHAVFDAVTTGTDETLAQKMVEQTRFVGMRHVNFGANFDAETWLHFKAAIINGLCPNRQSSSATLISCNKLLMFIIAEMKSAFLEEVRIENGKRTTAVSSGIIPQSHAFTPPPASRQMSDMYEAAGHDVQMSYGRQISGEVGLIRSQSSVQLERDNIDSIIDSLGLIDDSE